MKLCIAEKPSVGKDIAMVIGAGSQRNGYYEGNGYLVTWAIGHLVALAEPHDYGYICQDDIYKDNVKKQQAYDELPIFPEQFKLQVIPDTQEQFNVIKSLIHRADIEYIIDCGDMGAEGHILQWFIRITAGNKKPVKRMCATSMTREAIEQAMNNLVPVEKFSKIIQAEYCRKRADWILGMTMSRCASIKYNARIDVGRVLSPTLYFVVQRFIEVNNFQPQKYYQIQITFENNMKMTWKRDRENILGTQYKDSEGRINQKNIADSLIEKIRKEKSGIVVDVESKKRAKEHPLLYDITELQRDANKKYGYAAVETLAIAQALYERHKILTYPRTDSRYLTEDLKPYFARRVDFLGQRVEKYAESYNGRPTDDLSGDKRVFNSDKVTDHHAIILTDEIFDFNMDTLSDKEYKLIELVIRRMLAVASGKHIYQESKISVQINSVVFTKTVHTVIEDGWTVYEPESRVNTGDGLAVEKFVIGQDLKVMDVERIDSFTSSPQLHTEATLLTYMEQAGSKIEQGEILKGKGIGTQSTRAAIIAGLFDKGYVRSYKSKYLIPTKLGLNVIKILPKYLYSPQISAEWESKIIEIINGLMEPNDFLKELKVFIENTLQELKASNTVADFSAEKEVAGTCPFCGESVYFTHTNDKVYCSSETCKFQIKSDNMLYQMRTKKNLTKRQLYYLTKNNKITATCINKNQREYKGVFSIKRNEKGFATLDFSFPSSKK